MSKKSNVVLSNSLSGRLSRLERRLLRPAAKPMTKAQRDAMVRGFLTESDLSTLLSEETEPHRRAIMEAAMRADH